MTINVISKLDGVTGALQVNGTDAVTWNSTGLVSGYNNVLTAAAFASPAPARNKIFNGTFNHLRRGFPSSSTSTTITSAAPAYVFDNWYQTCVGTGAYAVGSYTNTAADETAAGAKLPSTSLKMFRANATASVENLSYALENVDSKDLIGKTVTLSFFAKKDTSFSAGTFTANIAYGTGSNQKYAAMTGRVASPLLTVTPTATFARYSLTYTIPSNATQVGLLFSVQEVGAGTLNGTDAIFITGVQLEVGSTATAFEFPDLNVESLVADRYCVQLPRIDSVFTSYVASSTNIKAYFPLRVPMRITSPTLVLGVYSFGVGPNGASVVGTTVNSTTVLQNSSISLLAFDLTTTTNSFAINSAVMSNLQRVGSGHVVYVDAAL